MSDMQMLLHLLDYAAAVTGFFLIAIWLKELIQLGTAFLFAPHFGFKVNRIMLFDRIFTKQDDTWTSAKGTRNVLIQCVPAVDLTRSFEPGELEKKEKQMEFLRCFVLLLVSGGILCLCLHPIARVAQGGGSLLDWFLTGLGIGICWHSLVSLGIRVYVYTVMMRHLTGYVQSLANRLRAGERFCEMGLRRIEELPYQNPKDVEKMLYYCFYLSAMLESGQIGAMQQPIREMTAFFRNREYIVSETLSYYWLIFYYSRFELNPPAATYFLNKIRPAIGQDKDANARRVLAYYAFGIEQDFPKARSLYGDAWMALDRMPVSGERELERKLLLDLDGFLREQGF